MTSMTPSTISIAKLLAEWDCNPFENCIWDVDTPITREEVAAAIESGTYKHADRPNDSGSRDHHVRRVAYLVVHGWEDPVPMDLGIPSLAFSVDWPIEDGNHRFAAAIFRGDPSIIANVSGEVDWIDTFLEAPTAASEHDHGTTGEGDVAEIMEPRRS